MPKVCKNIQFTPVNLSIHNRTQKTCTFVCLNMKNQKLDYYIPDNWMALVNGEIVPIHGIVWTSVRHAERKSNCINPRQFSWLKNTLDCLNFEWFILYVSLKQNHNKPMETKWNRTCYSAFCSFGNKLKSSHIDESCLALLLLNVHMNVLMESAVSDHGLKSERRWQQSQNSRWGTKC